MSEEELIVNELCKEYTDIMCWYPQPATIISKFSNVSLYKTRKILHELQQKEIVEFERGYVPDRFSYEGEWEEEAFFYCGWKLTEVGVLKYQNKIIEMNNKIVELLEERN